MSRLIVYVNVVLFSSALVAAADQPLASKQSPPMMGITWGTAKGEGVVCILVIGIQTRTVAVEVEEAGKKVTKKVPSQDCVFFSHLVTVDGKEVRAFGVDGKVIDPKELPNKLGKQSVVVLYYDAQPDPVYLQSFREGTVVLAGPKDKFAPPQMPRK